jgi:hypothetical protein
MKAFRSFRVFLLLVTLLAFPLLAFAPLPGVAVQASPPVDIVGIVLKIAMGFGSLVGVAALVSVVIDALKSFGAIGDGNAGRVSAVLNLLALGVFVYFGVFQPQVALEVLDGYAGQIAQVLLIVVGYLVQIFTAPAVHDQLKAMKIPILGASNSK